MVSKNIIDHKSDITILVSSCDKYSDLWSPLFKLYHHYWPNCKYDILLITEVLDANIPNVRSLQLGPGKDWSSLVLLALEQVKTDIVLFTLEDFFLRAPVDSNRIADLAELFRSQSLNMLRLIPRPGPNAPFPGSKKVGIIAKSAPYRVSTQAAFWSVDTLKDILVSGESAWEFENNGTGRSRHISAFVSVWESALPYHHHVIERGKWFPWSAATYRNMNIGVDLSARPVMSNIEAARWMINKIFSPFIKYIPNDLRKVVRNFRHYFS